MLERILSISDHLMAKWYRIPYTVAMLAWLGYCGGVVLHAVACPQG